MVEKLRSQKFMEAEISLFQEGKPILYFCLPQLSQARIKQKTVLNTRKNQTELERI